MGEQLINTGDLIMRNYKIEREMYRIAVELIEKRYPSGWGGAGVVHTAADNYYTSVFFDSPNAGATAVDTAIESPYMPSPSPIRSCGIISVTQVEEALLDAA